VCSDIEQGIPLVDMSVTNVIFLDCFAWIFNKNRALTESRRVLKKSGMLTIVNVFAATPRTRFWGYGISPAYLRDLLTMYFHTVTVYNNDHVDRIVGRPIHAVHTERYSCKAIK
jgi:ubiquinone/menaquinone biosynthesis C-methylase UbiE